MLTVLPWQNVFRRARMTSSFVPKYLDCVLQCVEPVAFGKILPFVRTASFRFHRKTSSGSNVHGTIYWIIKSIYIEYSVDRQFIYYGFKIPKICCSINKMHRIEMFSAFDANTQFSSFFFRLCIDFISIFRPLLSSH